MFGIQDLFIEQCVNTFPKEDQLDMLKEERRKYNFINTNSEEEEMK